jgi:hypothetical protein
MFTNPSQAENVQRQANQFLAPTQWQNELDALDVYPSVQAASNESMASLRAMFGQSAPNQPSRYNDDPLSQILRADRPQLETFKAAAHQNPFFVPSREQEYNSDLIFTGGNVDNLMRSADMPTDENFRLDVSTGLEARARPIMQAGDNQSRSKVTERKTQQSTERNIPKTMEYARFRL